MKLKLKNKAVKVAIIYLVISIVYIILSEFFLVSLNQSNYSRVQLIKGIGFVALTSLILYLLLNDLIKKLIKEHEDKKNLSDSLTDTEDKFHLLYENIGEAVLLADPDGKINSANQQACLMFRMNQQTLIGKNLAALIHAEGKEIFSVSQEFRGELKLLRPDNSVFIGFMVTKFYNDISEKKHISVIINDITEQKEYEDELLAAKDRMQLLIEGTPHLFFYIQDKNLNLTYVSPSVSFITGYSVNEWINRKDWFITDSPVNELAKKRTREHLTGIINTNPINLELKNAEGKTIFLEVYEKPIIRNNNVLGLQGVAHDVTENRKIMQDLVDAKDKAEEITRLKSIFLSNMSHELRTPLIGILGFAEMLLNDLDNKEQVEMAEIIYSSAKRLHQTLNLLLDLSRIESGKVELNYKELDLPDFLKRLYRVYSELVNKKAVQVKVENKTYHSTINTDERLLDNILNNLLSNAVKFTKEGSIIICAEENVIDNIPHLKLSVKDTGIGISPENCKVIFDEFRQASEGYSRRFEGSGLGLSIAQKFTHMLKGEIFVESVPGTGSEFYIIIPFSSSIKQEEGNLKKYN